MRVYILRNAPRAKVVCRRMRGFHIKLYCRERRGRGML